MANTLTSFRNIKLIAHFLKTSWLIVGITILSIISIEIICQMILFMHYSFHQYDNNVTIDYQIKGYDYKDPIWLNDYNNEFKSSFITEWKPFIYWRRKPFIGNYINIYRSGIRHTKQYNVTTNDTNRVIKIFMFGGSTLWGCGARDDYTIPSLVSKILSEHSVNVNITNFGESGYVNTQEVICLLLELQKNNIPDIVVFYDGVNDVFSAFQNGKAGLPQNEFNRRAEFNLLSSYNKLIKQSLLIICRKSATYRLCSAVARKLFNHNDANNEIVLNRKEYHKVSLDVINIYLSNLELINKISCGRFIAMFYWQPIIYDKNNLTEYERRQRCSDSIDFYKTVYTMVKTKAPLFDGYHFYNISDIFKDNTKPIFIDYCHLNETGNKIIAYRIADDILKFIQNKINANRKPVQGGP
jgi:lysophospholipase L1-like esterase